MVHVDDSPGLVLVGGGWCGTRAVKEEGENEGEMFATFTALVKSRGC